MKQMLVVVFDSEDKAYEASEALSSLNELSVIARYSDAVITKDRDGLTRVIKTHWADPQGTMGGTAVGSLIGMFGGPVGVAVGAASGFIIGATTDLAKARLTNDFVRDVENALVPGKAALVAEIDEDFAGPVDARMKELGGFVIHGDLTDVVNEKSEEHQQGETPEGKRDVEAKRAERVDEARRRYEEWNDVNKHDNEE
jgi:uncharacterized membrane protein